MSRRAVFLDKDGTLVEDVPYNVEADRLRFLPGTIEGLQTLHAAGYRLIVISNQSGVARGYFSEAALQSLAARLSALFAAAGVSLAGLYYCPHHPAGVVKAFTRGCTCRKPAPGLIFRAAAEQGIELGDSWFIGDILDDIEAGRRAGCRTVLLDNGHETEWVLSSVRQPDYVAADIAQAAGIITTLAADSCVLGERA